MLRGLCLLLTRWADEWHQGDVHVANILTTDIEAELSDGLEKREDFNIADSSTDFGDHDVDRFVSQAGDAALNFVGDVRNDLHGLSEIITTALCGDHGRVDRSGGRIRITTQRFVDEAFVVTEIEVGLTPVVSDENFAVFERIHSAGIDVEIRIELLHRDSKATALQQTSER